MTMANRRTNAPTNATWVICLILFLVAVLSNFGFVHVDHRIALWSWVIGYALLLLAVQVRGL